MPPIHVQQHLRADRGEITPGVPAARGVHPREIDAALREPVQRGAEERARIGAAVGDELRDRLEAAAKLLVARRLPKVAAF